MTRSAAIMMVLMLASMAYLGSAVAKEQAEQPQSVLPTPMIVFDEESGTLFIALPVDGELPECRDLPLSLEASLEGYGPDDCIEITVEHPSGKLHHGALVSAAAKELHPSMLDGIKKGEIMRWVAKTGKGGGEEVPTAADPGDEDDEKTNNGKSDQAPGKDPDKNSDKPGNGNNPGNKDNPGNGNGNGRDNPGKGKGSQKP